MNKTSLIIISSLLGGALAAQEPPARQPEQRTPPTQNPQNREQSQEPRKLDGQQAQETDKVLISWLLHDNENEIALARVALQRGQSPQVKQFAQMMIDDHGKAAEMLRQAGDGNSGIGKDAARGEANGGRSSEGAKPGVQQPADRTREASGSSARNATEATGSRTAGSFDHMQLIRNLSAKCQQSALEALQQKQGAEFDRCYMGMQLGAHMKAKDTLEVFRGYASSTLRASLEQTLTTVKQHKLQAEQIVRQLESEWKTAASSGR